MNVSEAKAQVIELLMGQLSHDEFIKIIDTVSPDPNNEGRIERGDLCRAK